MNQPATTTSAIPGAAPKPASDNVPVVTSAAMLAERALIGALIWEPDRTHDVADWLDTGDFESPVDARLYEVLTAMVAHARTDRLVFELPDALARGLYSNTTGAEPRHGLADWMLRVHERLRATPAPAPRPSTSDTGQPSSARLRSEHVRWAWYVLEASTRRTVAATGSRIEHLATRAAVQPEPDIGLDDVTAALQRAVTRLDDLAERLATAEERTPTRIRRHEPGRRDYSSTALTRRDPRELAPCLSGKQLRRAERDTLAGALALPDLREHLVVRLEPDDFVHPPAAGLWAALLAVHHRGDPVDYITVAWQAERDTAAHGIPADMDELASIGTAVPSAPRGYTSAEVVARHAMLRYTAHAGRDIQDAARIVTVNPELLGQATRSLRAAQHHVQRLSNTSPRGPSTSTAVETTMPRQRDAAAATAPASARGWDTTLTAAEQRAPARTPLPTPSTKNPSASPRATEANHQSRLVR